MGHRGFDYWVTPRLAAGCPSNLISLCVLRARTSLSDLLLIAPRRQDRKDGKEKYFSISPNLAPFAPWNILSTEALSFLSRHYFTGRAPWNTDSTKIELFTLSAIPQGRVIFYPIFSSILWIVFVYHEAHDDYEEFTIKLHRPLRFKPRGRYNLILYKGLLLRETATGPLGLVRYR